MLALVRPRQWAKNLLVLAAPLAAGSILEPGVARASALTLIAFTLASAGGYALNDGIDRDADRRHPVKCRRPVAAGLVGTGTAIGFGGLLWVAAIGVPLATGLPAVAGLVGLYIALTSAYSLWLKDHALFDIAAIVAMFVVRPIGGAVGADINMSRWFLIVTAFGSLYVVATKRFAELAASDGATDTRASLDGYQLATLHEIRLVAATTTVVAYVAWALDRSLLSIGVDPWATLTIAPFVLALFRFSASAVDRAGEAPEEIILGDRVLQALGASWLVLFVLAVHA
jgi:decaprenyl-phosphate phosphoribosyltransferase